MKRFMLFGFSTYYPEGGMDDFIWDYDTLEEVLDDLKKFSCEHCHVLDLETKEIKIL